MSIKADPEWWKTMFDEVYLLTDARSVCNEEITRREVDLICELLPITRGQKIQSAAQLFVQCVNQDHATSCG